MNITYTLSQLPKVVAEVWANYGDARIFAFEGEMGAGKTTFIRTLCAHIGVIDPVSSPTYALINEYETIKGLKVRHADLYRLSSAEEALEAGMEEQPLPGELVLIEWPELFGAYLPENTVWLRLRTISDNERSLHVHIPR